LHDLVEELRRTATSPLGAAVLDLLTTPDTQFYRDPDTFDDLRERLLPELMQARRATRRLRIWSAATGTGQEAYSTAIMLRDDFPDIGQWCVELLATDLSIPAILRAAAGRYSQTEVQLGLPIRQLVRHFHPVDGAWQISDDLRRMVKFQALDLLEPFPSVGQFDLILCRNVLSWFSPSEKRSVLERLAQSLRPDGYLLLGAAESAWGVAQQWEPVDGCRSVAYTPTVSATGVLRIADRVTA
ncbi:MAG TPA: CheR family methyltransferase, partial [Planctomycetaceae bacterium]|nr:CheR family methyltransferase [Planctomycetaceae bacterium]